MTTNQNFFLARAVAETLTIDHVGHRGDGVAFADGEQVFVPLTLPGEIVAVDAASSSERRRLVNVARASPDRIAPFCPYFGACGGCAMQHWQAAPYQAWKRQIVVDTLSQAGIGAEVAPLIDAHGAGRRRITLHARHGNDGALRVGFAAAQSHDIVAIAFCPILDPAMEGALPAARALADKLASIAKPLDIQITATHGGLDIDMRGSGPLGSAHLTALSRLAEQHRLARITRHGELVLLRAPPLVAMGRAHVTLPPGSFLQATAAGEETLAALVTRHCGKAKHVADLFCGVGPFALRLAEKSRVAAFDNAALAVDALAKAASGTSKLKPVAAAVRDLFQRPLVPQELSDFDAVVFDPPRQGALAQVTQLAKSRVPVVVAVSCNVATFARDARILIDGGYKIGAVTPVDQFRHTPHVELVASFTRGVA